MILGWYLARCMLSELVSLNYKKNVIICGYSHFDSVAITFAINTKFKETKIFRSHIASTSRFCQNYPCMTLSLSLLQAIIIPKMKTAPDP